MRTASADIYKYQSKFDTQTGFLQIKDKTYIPVSNLVYVKRQTSWGSSVSIVSGYGLDERAIEVRSPAEVKVIFFL
jgi:hypothetical protein